MTFLGFPSVTYDLSVMSVLCGLTIGLLDHQYCDISVLTVMVSGLATGLLGYQHTHQRSDSLGSIYTLQCSTAIDLPLLLGAS